jgi:hypothetical protein
VTPGRRIAAGAGYSLLELTLVLGLVALLCWLGAGFLRQGHAGLAAAQGELRASVEQAFLLARARGTAVVVGLRGHSADCAGLHPGGEYGAVPPLTLPRGVRWGIADPSVPLPPGAEATLQANRTGQAHLCITVTPDRTAEGNAWYLSDGEDAVYLGLSGLGRITLLRWRHHLGQWRRA